MTPTQEETKPQATPSAAPAVAGTDAKAIEFFQDAYKELKRQLAKVIVGQDEVIDEILIAIFTRNHALLMGVPGLAKTLLISTLAKTLTLSFKRIQFTPDLMPSDITGTEVIHTDPVSGSKEFRFMHGPVFSNIVLADEINRTPPKTQAAMLEAMQERRVTVGGNTHKLPEPFFVLATQNPLEQEGTYPLPEAQLDRFLFLINVGYPSEEEEFEIMRRGTSGKPEEPKAIMGAEHIQYLQDAVRQMPVADHVYKYAERIVRSTRPKQPDAIDYCKKFLSFGAGPRASLGLIMAAKGHALLKGQVYTGCENVAAIAKSVMRHRMAVNFTAQSEGITADTVVEKILEAVPAR